MYTLGIETSCDETSAAVVKDGARCLSNEISSSLTFHAKYGGVVPEIASRMQLETIAPVTDAALKKARVPLKDIGLISVTSGPGLLGSLLVGISFAKSLSLALHKPLVGVNHVHSHMYANFLDASPVKLPFIGLVVSGGHTSLFLVEDFDRITLLGRTVDDACGEAFDKVAKILGLGYPGGPLIEALAKKGDPRAVSFRCCGTAQPLDFSFSGIKTAVLYHMREHGPKPAPGLAADIAASFQETVIQAIIRKALHACEAYGISRLVIGGGVVMNARLREEFKRHCAGRRISCFFPSRELCMDNAAMVAGFGYRLYKKGFRSDLRLNAELS